MKPKNNKTKRPNSQTYLPIAEIKKDTVVLKDGTMRTAIMVSSINFALKSEEEQEALISSYVSFLNGLDFPLQIVVQSRRLQIQPYLDNLGELERGQANELLRAQIADYRSFVGELVEMGQIMTKKFYVIVPFDPLSNKKKSFWKRFKEVLSPAMSVRVKEERFMIRKEDLEMRVNQVMSGLSSMGLQAVRLNTQALIELYYSTYNPDISFSEQMQAAESIQIENN